MIDKEAVGSIGTANNAGAILVLGRDLVVVPKLIHPLPPAITSPESSPEHHLDDTWMQVCPFYMLFALQFLLKSLNKRSLKASASISELLLRAFLFVPIGT